MDGWRDGSRARRYLPAPCWLCTPRRRRRRRQTSAPSMIGGTGVLTYYSLDVVLGCGSCRRPASYLRSQLLRWIGPTVVSRSKQSVHIHCIALPLLPPKKRTFNFIIVFVIVIRPSVRPSPGPCPRRPGPGWIDGSMDGICRNLTFFANKVKATTIFSLFNAMRNKKGLLN